MDSDLLLTLSSEAEIAQVFWAGGDDAIHSAIDAALRPLRRAAASAPLGCLQRLPSATQRPVFVVVLGDTGAGKSSTLNAVIGERKLLPTNGMRACTAAIVEARRHAPQSSSSSLR